MWKRVTVRQDPSQPTSDPVVSPQTVSAHGRKEGETLPPSERFENPSSTCRFLHTARVRTFSDKKWISLTNERGISPGSTTRKKKLYLADRDIRSVS